jgi:hypothetical protein
MKSSSNIKQYKLWPDKVMKSNEKGQRKWNNNENNMKKSSNGVMIIWRNNEKWKEK